MAVDRIVDRSGESRLAETSGGPYGKAIWNQERPHLQNLSVCTTSH